jgi:hypothetical protein
MVGSQNFSCLLHLTVYYRKNKSFKFSHHAGMVSEFLRQPKALLEYVVTTSYPKILKRLDCYLSKPYLDFLKNTTSSSRFPQFMDIPVPGDLKPKHYRNDRRFFFKILPQLENLHTITPKLSRALLEAFNKGEPPIEAYNKDTYIEFHNLLVKLLNLFIDSLKNLDGLKNAHDKVFELCLSRVLVLGDALRAIAGGFVIEVHLKIITTNCVSLKPLRGMRDMNEETDEDIYHISSRLPPWSAFSEWLKLMVVQFDAVRILISHMQTVLYPPPHIPSGSERNGRNPSGSE